MMTAIRRRGRYLEVVDAEGRRHAVRHHAVQSVHEDGDDPGRTILTAPQGRVIVVDVAYDSVMDVLDPPENEGGHERR